MATRGGRVAQNSFDESYDLGAFEVDRSGKRKGKGKVASGKVEMNDAGTNCGTDGSLHWKAKRA